MQDAIHDLILKVTGADDAFMRETVQSLWGGYGYILRYGLSGCRRQSVIVKHVKLSAQRLEIPGSNEDLAHRRKVRSYQVETFWYQHWAKCCDDDCRTPTFLGFEAFGDDIVIVLEDLDTVGFPGRRSRVDIEQISACLEWLANFHATFMGMHPHDLWPTGTYWHLDTRPYEWEALEDIALKSAAVAIDQALRDTPYQTFVHGDAKLANFCFSPDGTKVAAVDFQYVGGGCGIKDVAYFIDSCLGQADCERRESELLDIYFRALQRALERKQKSVDPRAVERDWRELYSVAWTDFHRFLKGWAPGYWPRDSYSERLARQVIAQLLNH